MATTVNKQSFLAYLYFWVGQAISVLGSTIVQFVLIWWIVVEYKDPLYLSLAYLLAIGVQVIFMPLAGVFVDRWNRKLILFVSDFLQAVGAVLLIILFVIKSSFSAETLYWLVICLLCFRGIMNSFHVPAARAIIPLMVPRRHLDRLNGLQVLVYGVINITGTTIGAVLYQLFPLDIIIWIDCITFLIAVIPLIFINIPKIEKKIAVFEVNGVQSFFGEFRDGLHIIKTKKGLISLILVMALINFIEIPIIVLGPFFVYITHGGAVQDLALVVAASQLGLLLSGLILLIKKGSNKKVLIIIIAFYIQITGYLIQVITPIGFEWSFWFMAIGAFIFGSMLPIVNSLFHTIIQVIVPPELQGRVTSIIAGITGSILPIGMIASGPLADIFGIQELFLAAIVLGFLVLSFVWFFTNIRLIDDFEEMGIYKDTVPTDQTMNISN